MKAARWKYFVGGSAWLCFLAVLATSKALTGVFECLWAAVLVLLVHRRL